MNKKLVNSLAVITTLFLPVLVLAAEPSNFIVTIIDNVLSMIVWPLFIGLVIIMSIWAGILFLTARGSEDQLGKAKKFVVWIIVGIFVAILGYGAYATIVLLIS